MLLAQFAAEIGLVSAADPAVDWRLADVGCPSAGHLDEEAEEVGTFTVWKTLQKDLFQHRCLLEQPSVLAHWWEFLLRLSLLL